MATAQSVIDDIKAWRGTQGPAAGVNLTTEQYEQFALFVQGKMAQLGFVDPAKPNATVLYLPRLPQNR